MPVFSDAWLAVCFGHFAVSYLTSRCRTSKQRSAMSWKDLASSLRVCMICSDTGGRSMFTWLSWAGDDTEKRDEDKTPITYGTRCLQIFFFFFEMTCYFVAHHAVLTNLANARVGSIRCPGHDSLFLYLIKHRGPADCLESIHRMMETEFQSWKWPEQSSGPTMWSMLV